MINRPFYINKMMRYIDTPFVKILTGVRYCGKSTILQMLMAELGKRGVENSRLLCYRFDSLEYDHLKTAPALYSHLKQKLSPKSKTYLFLNEIQEVTEWEKVVNSLMNDYDVDIYVTGSDYRMMPPSELSTYLTGRYISFRIFPLSFGEYLTFREIYGEMTDTRSELANYLRLGGYPAVHLQSYTLDEVNTIVKDIHNTTLSTFSLSRYDYPSKLERAYLLHRCSRYDVQGKEILKTQEKFYLADPALRYSVLGYSPDSIAAMLENIVYLELRRRGYDVFVGKLDSAEIDFVATRQEKKLYIQVSQQISTPETEQREYGRLLDIRDNYPKYVLRTDVFAGGNYEGIETMHVADFLLSESY